MTIYRAHAAGFTNTFETLSDLRNWINDLCARYELTGEVLTIHQGERFGKCDEYRAHCPTRKISL